VAAKRKAPAHAGGKTKNRKLTRNALRADVVSAIVAGLVSLLVSLLVTHSQEREAAGQARVGQQALAAGQLEAAATALYQGTTGVYDFQLKCTRTRQTWQDCAAQAPGLANFSAHTATFDAVGADIADPAAA
jgi:hypothetical protein